MLDQRALQKDGFVEGDRITLGDGQSWAFPKPMLREFRAEFSPDSGAKFGPSVLMTYRAGYLARLDDLIASEGGIEQIEIVATMAGELLRRNYDLGYDQLGGLLTYVQTEAGELEESSLEMWQALANVVAGISSKKDTSVG